MLADTTRITTNREAAFVSAPIERLAAEGFVQAEGDSATTYYAPDAGALISDVFLDTHCMRVREGDDGRLGLTFEADPRTPGSGHRRRPLGGRGDRRAGQAGVRLPEPDPLKRDRRSGWRGLVLPPSERCLDRR